MSGFTSTSSNSRLLQLLTEALKSATDEQIAKLNGIEKQLSYMTGIDPESEEEDDE